MKITVFGTGYVGLVTGACLANLGHEVLCMDIDQQKVNQLRNGQVAFYEPGLQELVQRMMRHSRLSFTVDAEEAVHFAEVVFNCVGTPEQADRSADLAAVFSVAETFGRYLNGYKILVNKSTVPPGTSRKTTDIILAQHPRHQFDVVSNPEFLKEGAAVNDFEHPDKIVFGTRDPQNSDQVFNLMKRLYRGRERDSLPVIETDWETAEMIKYAQNTFLATKITFANEIANICEGVGADVRQVVQALGLDYRINPKFMHPGVGYGGSCFPKDIRALCSLAGTFGYQPTFLTQVDASNERQKSRMVEKITAAFTGDLSGKTLAVLGLSFKPKTSDMREAPSRPITTGLLHQGAHVRAYDPVAMEEARKVLSPDVVYCSSPYDALTRADGLVLVTEWDEFRNLDWKRVKELMSGNKIFDGRNIWSPLEVKEAGFEYYGIGRQ